MPRKVAMTWQSKRTDRVPPRVGPGRFWSATFAMANNSISPAVIQAEQPSNPRIPMVTLLLTMVSDFAMTVASMPLSATQPPRSVFRSHLCSEFPPMTDDFLDERRRFLGMSLAAAGATMAGPTHAAEPEKPSAAPAQKPVYLVVYRPGPAFIEGQPLKAQPLRPHFNYMLELYRKGTLRFAGGFADDTGGAAMFEANGDEEAAALIAVDPAVTSRVFAYELRRWNLVAWEKVAGRTSA